MFLLQATVDGNSDIYMMPAIGGKPKRITTDPTLHMAPSWSADGKWIYFSATPAPSATDKHRSQIWRVPAEGGNATQLLCRGDDVKREGCFAAGFGAEDFDDAAARDAETA